MKGISFSGKSDKSTSYYFKKLIVALKSIHYSYPSHYFNIRARKTLNDPMFINAFELKEKENKSSGRRKKKSSYTELQWVEDECDLYHPYSYSIEYLNGEFSDFSFYSFI